MDFRHRYPYYPWSEKEVNEIAEELEIYADSEIANDRCPTISGFAAKIRIHRSNLYDWEKGKKYPRLDEALDYMRARQEEALLNKSLDRTWDSGTAKLSLSSHHGYTDRNTLLGDPEKPLQVNHDPRKAAAEIIAEHERRKSKTK